MSRVKPRDIVQASNAWLSKLPQWGLAAAALIAVGIFVWVLYGWAVGLATGLGQPGTGGRQVAIAVDQQPGVTTTPQCDGLVRFANLTRAPQTLNPGDVCNMYGLVKEGRVMLASIQTGDSVEVGPEGANLAGRNFGKAWATTGTALFKYVLCPGVKRNMDTWACE
jgi:hypothetical protein